MTERPLIVTAKMDEAAQKFFNDKRKFFFPPARNFLDAHITLFHALPGNEIEAVRDQLQLRQVRFPLKIDVTGLQFTGNGFAYKLASSDLVQIRDQMAASWLGWLTPQDRQAFRPHVTIQNKVHADIAKNCYAQELEKFQSFSFKILSLELWHYDYGPWLKDKDT